MHAPITTELAVGERLEMRRRRRGLSRKVVANLAGRSEEWLRLVESGRRKLDSVEVLIRLAEILQIDNLTELIDMTPTQPAGFSADSDMLEALRGVILDHPMLRVSETSSVTTQFDTELLRADLSACGQIWNTASKRYSRLARDLPAVVRTSQQARWGSREDASARLLVQAYHLARQLLTACGDHTLAAVVADRAMDIATSLGDARLIAASAWEVGNTLMGMSYPVHCQDYVLAAARRLSADLPDTAAETALWGALHLLAAQAAAATKHSQDVMRLLANAANAADAVGANAQCCGIQFGPTEVGLIGIQVALTSNNPDEAIRLAATIEPTADLLPARRARYHICQAVAYVHRRDEVAAALALTKAAKACPEDIRFDPDARHAVRQLLRHDNYLVRPEVRHLAELAGFQ
ncbi:helix-turn-helix domain-containing protein [Nocardia sp. NPDC059091]|uniref:helix-turn-helix domain-containing protein n=1 Tax=unclassified Nocardia TaxID=2637762 RepID=UPI0036C52194